MGSQEGLRLRAKASLKPIDTTRRTRGIDQVEAVKGCGVDGEPVSPSGILLHEPNFNVHIVAILGCKTKIMLDIAKAKLPNTLLKHPRFSSIMVMDEKDGGKMKWVKTKVELDNHIIVPKIPENIESPDKFVEDYIYELTKSSIDLTKPMWEIHVLNVKTMNPATEGVGIFRIHHSLGDGTSLISLLLACTRQVANPEALPTLPVRKREERGFIRTLDLSRCLIGILWLLRLIWNTLVDVTLFLAATWFVSDTQTPISAPPDSVLNPRRILHKTMSLDDMKLVKNAMNLTINDVAFGITQAGLTRYLNRRYGEINNNDKGETAEKNNLPKNIRIRSILLINIRPSPGIQDLADMMEKDTKAKWGNWVGYVLLPLDIGFKKDPLDYIRSAKAIIERKKHSLEVVCTSAIAKFVLKFFGIKQASDHSHKIFLNTSLVFSNLVGPQEEIGFYGHELEYLAPSSYGQPHALMVNFQSYINKMTLVLAVDEVSFPNAHQLCDDIAEALKLVKDAVIEKGLAKE